MSAEIKYIKGNIFTSRHQTLVNTVNCVGVMGAGIALEFRYRYPEMFNKYVSLCETHQLQIGKLWIYDVPNKDQKILNFPTKNDWKHPSKYEYLTKGLERFLETYKEKKITSVAFPLLGAQHGGLDPENVKKLMYDYLQKADIPVEIYEYSPTASDDLLEPFTKGLLYSQNEFAYTTRLSTNTIAKLKDIISKNDFYSLIQLTKVKGLGEETIKACFQFAMKHKQSPMLAQEISYDVSDVKESLVSEEIAEYKSRDKNKAKTSQPLSIEQKSLATSLSSEIIRKIENKDQDVSVRDIKMYCTALHIKVDKFFKDYIS